MPGNICALNQTKIFRTLTICSMSAVELGAGMAGARSVDSCTWNDRGASGIEVQLFTRIHVVPVDLSWSRRRPIRWGLQKVEKCDVFGVYVCAGCALSVRQKCTPARPCCLGGNRHPA